VLGADARLPKEAKGVWQWQVIGWIVPCQGGATKARGLGIAWCSAVQGVC